MLQKMEHQKETLSKNNSTIHKQGNGTVKNKAVTMQDIFEIVLRIRRNPKSMTSEDMKLLQHTIGNQAVIKLCLKSTTILKQKKRFRRRKER